MLSGSPHGSVMSCQSLAASRAFTDSAIEKDVAHPVNFHRSVRFSSESRSSTRVSSSEAESRRETPGSVSLLTLSVTPSQSSSMTQSAPPLARDDESPPPPASCRFPKLEECAHFHYERVSLGGLAVEIAPCDVEQQCATHNGDAQQCEGWICLKVRSHVNSSAPAPADEADGRGLSASWTEASDVREWSLTRNAGNFLQLDNMLHRCIYDRKVSGLLDLAEEITESLLEDKEAYTRLIADYAHHLSIIADDTINCGPVLNWLQMDNKGHKLLVANEDSSSINTPAVAAAYSVRKYTSQARDEISFEVGDMISIIDMPGPNESLWWRGKRGFRVGFFPHHCVAVIGDKVPRHMTQPPPIVGSVAVAPIKPVLRKHGKLISLFRSFILSRPSRRSLKQQGILRERVFGCDLGEHLLNAGHEVPLVLQECARVIESRGAVDGIYRLSGGSGLIQRLRAAFDENTAPDLAAPPVARDPHALASLLKMYFRELPNPLCTYQLYSSFVAAVQSGTSETERLAKMRECVVKLPPPHYRTLAYLMRHLRRVSLLGPTTGMTARNMAIVWAPNLLRSPHAHNALQGVAVQAVVTEFLICFAEDLFSEEQGADWSSTVGWDCERDSELQRERDSDSARRARPKSLPLHAPPKLLSLEEARRRGAPAPATSAPRAPPALPAARATPAPASPAAQAQLRPATNRTPKYIEVGSGPNNLPQYHTVLDLPLQGGAKRGLKRSPSGWRGLFSRTKQQRPRARAHTCRAEPPPATRQGVQDTPMPTPGALRPVKSCESLQSESDTLAPLADKHSAPLKQHTRSASCDSYFEPWQCELADMRLRLSPQERDHNMFSEEDDVTLNHQPDASLCSSPAASELCSVEPSPRRHLRVDIHAANDGDRKRVAIEEQLANIGYIDGGDSPRGKPAAEKRHSDVRPGPTDADIAKRLCKDRDSPVASLADFQSSIVNVKLRERNSPRKARSSARYSGMHHLLTNLTDTHADKHVTVNSRLSWHGKDGHSTLIKIDWPLETNSISNLTNSTRNSTPITPITPTYDPLESDSELSETTNKHTIKITENKNCNNCDKEKCLKCELKATDYENVKADFKIGQAVSKTTSIEPVNLHDSLEASPVPSTNISYQNLNRLSAISSSSNSEPKSDKHKDYENVENRKSVMESSHESSSSFSNPSKDELYECYSFTRPNYINLQSSSSKSSPTSPLKSPLKSTISITFRSPTKSKSEYELIQNIDTPTNERDSVYEDIDLEKNLSIVEEATVPETDASLPTQQACQPDNYNQDLIILETPNENVDVYSQVKFFKKSIEEVNAMVLESPEKEKTKFSEPSRHYENVQFLCKNESNDYENINVEALRICDKKEEALDNGNIVKKNLNVRELAHRFESPTEQKGPFCFEKFKAEIKYPSLERKENDDKVEIRQKDKPTVSPKSFRLSKHSVNARSLDENAFVQEFSQESVDRRKSLEVRDVVKREKYLPDLNLNLEESNSKTEEITTPTTENKISLIQRFDKPDLKNIIGFDSEKKLSRERIEKYKEERRNFLREKYSSQSFRSNPDHLTRIKLKRETDSESDDKEQTKEEDLPKFERRNTVDLGTRMRFSLAKSADNLDDIQSPEADDNELGKVEGASQLGTAGRSRDYDRREKVSPSYNIRDMAAMFEQKSQGHGTG